MSKRIITIPSKSYIDDDYSKEKTNISIYTWSPKYGPPYDGIYAVIIADHNKFEGI